MPPKKAAAPKSVAGRKKVKKEEPIEFNEPEKMPDLVFNPIHNQAPAYSKIGFYKKIAYSFVFLTLILLAVIFYFSFVKLSIVLVPAEEKINDNLVFDVLNKNTGTAVDGRSVNGLVENVNLEDEQEYQTSGAQVIGEEVTGKVVIVNNYNKNQPLVATTRLMSSDSKLFRTKETVNVPAGGSVEVDVYADQTSQDMAIGPTKFTLPGLWAGLQDKIYAESKEPFVYDKKVKKFIDQSDLDQAAKDIKNNLIAKAKKEIGENYKGFDQVIYSIDDNSVTMDIDSKVGEEKDNFNIKIKAAVTVVAFSNEDVAKMAENKLSGIIPSDKKLFGFDPKEIQYSINKINLSQGNATLNSEFEGDMVIKGDSEIIDPNKIIGLTREQLKDYLSSFKEIESYEIKFTPSFVNKVPNLVDRIAISIKSE